ncbi:hypothetical protein HTG_19035 [Natrinema mahii]|nr:hypothetical protein HTG_19035 [Natrinema mahii]
MIISGGSLRFARKHIEQLFIHSKTAAISSFSVFAYSVAIIVTIILGAASLSLPTTDLLTIAINTFFESPVKIFFFSMLTIIVQKIELLKWMSFFDPHDHHPVVDFIIGFPIFVVGLALVLSVLEQLQNLSTSASDGLYVLAEIFLLVGAFSAAMFCAAVTVNGGCRILSNGFTGLLLLGEIRELPTLASEWILRHCDRILYLVEAAKTISKYADEQDIPKYSAAIEIFDNGLNQVGLDDGHSDEEQKGQRDGDDDGDDVVVSHREQ